VTVAVSMVTIDSTEPERLVEFWTAALGYRVEKDWSGHYVMLAPPEGSPPGAVRVSVQRAEQTAPGKNRLHLDLVAADRPAEVERLVGLGATVVAERSAGGHHWVVLADPGGNQFCVA
jgi:predicted enzyme related to lactoylglutathione lyase